MAREQLKADSCKVKMERCVQDMHDSSAASTVAHMAKKRAGILAQETAMASANTKKQRLPSISNSVSSSRVSTKAKNSRVQPTANQLMNTTRSPSFKAAFLHSLQEFASVTECSSLPVTVSSMSSMRTTPSTIVMSESVYGLHLQNQSTSSSEGTTNTLPTFVCSDPGSNRSSLSSSEGSADMIISSFQDNTSSSLINRVVSDDSTAAGKDVQHNHRQGRETDNTRNSIQNSIEGQQHPVKLKLSADISKWRNNSDFLHALDPNFRASTMANTITSANLPRGITLRPSGKWQAQLYFAGQSRYIGVFDSRERAVLAYEIVREKVKDEPENKVCSCPLMAKEIFDLARQAAFAGVQSISHN